MGEAEVAERCCSPGAAAEGSRRDAWAVHQCSAPGGARWEQVVSGMHVYAPEELHTVLERSGFQTIQVFENKQGWLCVIARKEGKLQ